MRSEALRRQAVRCLELAEGLPDSAYGQQLALSAQRWLALASELECLEGSANVFALNGRKGGLKTANLRSPEQRSMTARSAALKRWHGIRLTPRQSLLTLPPLLRAKEAKRVF